LVLPAAQRCSSWSASQHMPGLRKNIYSVFQKEIYNDIPNAIMWRVLRKRLHLTAYKLSIFRHLEHLEYHCKALFEAPGITSWSHIEP
jgi:hypothetical protein